MKRRAKMITETNHKKKTALTKKAARLKSAEGPFVTIDHPQNGEKLAPHHYSIRIGSGGGSGVEVSIDGGEWQAARENSGYYWYDWHQIPAGKHKITARVRME